ncbi:MAG: GNAT family N-acetyltransferase [Hyphomicrobiaceae bacterium]
MTATIRPVQQPEKARWEELFRAYGTFYKVDVTPQAVEAVWGWIHDPAEPFWCDVAEDGQGKLIGMTQYQMMHRSLGGSMVVYLSDLYVEPGLRGGGVGRALIEHVLAFAKARGAPSVRWLTQDFNYKGRMLYDTFAPKSDFILYNVPVA